MTGAALKLRLELKRLAQRHRVPPPTLVVEQQLPPADGPCILSGLATVPIVDHERVRFRPYSLSWLSWQLPQLRYRHEPEVIGTVDRLEWTAKGLEVMVTTDHEQAKCAPAFSICCSVQSYTLRNADSPHFFAEVTSAWLEEVSLTDRPANPMALVFERAPASPVVHGFYPLMQQRAATMLKLAELVQRGAPP